MSMIKRSNKLIVLLLCVALLVSGLALALSGTFASPPDEEFTATNPRPELMVLDVGVNQSVPMAGVRSALRFATNENIEATYDGTHFQITPLRAGVSGLAYATTGNASFIADFIVRDNDLVASYSFPADFLVRNQVARNQTVQIADFYTITDGRGQDYQLTWHMATTGRPAASFDPATGIITAGNDNGVAFFFTTFTDIWGESHSLFLTVEVDRGTGTVDRVVPGTGGDDDRYFVLIDDSGRGPNYGGNVYVETDEDGRPLFPPTYWEFGTNPDSGPTQVWPNPNYPDQGGPWLTQPPIGTTPSNPFEPPVGGTFVDSEGVKWQILDVRPDGSRLLITYHVHGTFEVASTNNHSNTPYNTTNVWTPFPQSALRGSITSWANGTLPNSNFRLASEIATVARAPVGVERDVRSEPSAGNDHSFWVENGAAGRTTPGAAMQNANALFVLSLSEVNQYFDSLEARRAACANDSAFGDRFWWTRSPGQAQNTAVSIAFNGQHGAGLATNGSGFRPAVWIAPQGWAEPAPDDPFDVPVGGHFRDNGIWWRVMHDDGNGNRLIMTEHVHMNPINYHYENFSDTVPFRHLNASPAPSIRAELTGWWDNVSPSLQARAVPVIGADRDVRDTWYGYTQTELGAAGLTSPGTGAADGTALFILSISEVNRYFGVSASNPERSTTAPHETDATNGAPSRIGVHVGWFLRTPARSNPAGINTVAAINTIGARANRQAVSTPGNLYGVRPALWVSVN